MYLIELICHELPVTLALFLWSMKARSEREDDEWWPSVTAGRSGGCVLNGLCDKHNMIIY